MPRVVPTSAEAAKGNGNEELREEFKRTVLQKQSSNGGAEVKRIKHHRCYLMGGHKGTG